MFGRMTFAIQMFGRMTFGIQMFGRMKFGIQMFGWADDIRKSNDCSDDIWDSCNLVQPASWFKPSATKPTTPLDLAKVG